MQRSAQIQRHLHRTETSKHRRRRSSQPATLVRSNHRCDPAAAVKRELSGPEGLASSANSVTCSSFGDEGAAKTLLDNKSRTKLKSPMTSRTASPMKTQVSNACIIVDPTCDSQRRTRHDISVCSDGVLVRVCSNLIQSAVARELNPWRCAGLPDTPPIEG